LEAIRFVGFVTQGRLGKEFLKNLANADDKSGVTDHSLGGLHSEHDHEDRFL